MGESLRRYLAGGQRQPCKQAAEVLALLERRLSAVDLRDVADDRQAEARAGLSGGIEPSAAGEQLAPQFPRDSRSVVLDEDVDHRPPGLNGHEDSAAAIFRSIL